MRSLITKTQLRIDSRKYREDGADTAKYGLLVTLIALAAIGGAAAIGGLDPKFFTILA